MVIAFFIDTISGDDGTSTDDDNGESDLVSIC